MLVNTILKALNFVPVYDYIPLTNSFYSISVHHVIETNRTKYTIVF